MSEGHIPNMDSKITSQVLDITMREGGEKLAPYTVFLQKFAEGLVRSSIIDQDILQKMVGRLEMANDVQTMSVQEIMRDENYDNDLWHYMRYDYMQARKAAISKGGEWFDFDDPKHNKNLDLITKTVTSVLRTIDQIKSGY